MLVSAAAYLESRAGLFSPPPEFKWKNPKFLHGVDQDASLLCFLVHLVATTQFKMLYQFAGAAKIASGRKRPYSLHLARTSAIASGVLPAS